jgi:hypothetical protein
MQRWQILMGRAECRTDATATESTARVLTQPTTLRDETLFVCVCLSASVLCW